jgi:nitroreductase
MAKIAVSKSASRSAGTRLQHSLLWRIKVRLQFTGWFQYLPTATAALALLLVAAMGRLIGVWPLVLFWIPACLGGLLLAVTLLDLVTVKLGIRPAEAVPRPTDDLDAFDLMRTRRSCRSFQPRNLLESHLSQVLASVRAHTAADVLIGDSPIRFEYIAGSLTVWPSVGAHEFLVAIGPKAYDRMAIVDVGRSLQRVVLDATRMGVATCWIGPGADHASVVQHLGERFDPEADHIICVCALGYKSRYLPLFIHAMQYGQRRRLPLASLFFADAELREPLDVGAPPFARFGRSYEVCQWSPSSYNGQTTRCVGVADTTGDAAQAIRFDFYASTRSRYYAPVAVGIWCADWEAGCEALGIAGRFAALPAEARGVHAEPDVPHYDVSWIADNPDTAGALTARA